MKDFDLRKYLAENKLLKEEQMGSYGKFLKVVKSYEDEEILSDFLDSYPKGQDISKSEYERFTEKHLGLSDPEDYRGKNWKYIMSEGKLLKEDNIRDYWSEWAAGEIEVGNDDVIDAGGVDADFENVRDETMNTFNDYVKSVKVLNADSKELRNDIAGAVSGITFNSGDFEDYEFDILTADQFDTIKDII